MKTRKILAASTAALLSFASVAVVASAAVDISELDEDGVDIGDGVKATLSDSDIAKFGDDFNISASAVDVDEGDKDKDNNVLVSDASDVVKDLSKSLKKEISKIKYDEFAIIDIELADGDFVETTAPVAISFTVEVGFDAKVYHVNGENVDLVKSRSRKMTNGNYEVTFATKSFSPFIFTTADLTSKKPAADNTESKPANDDASQPAAEETPAVSEAENTNPAETGIALAIAPVVLAAGAVAVVALKRKH